MKENILNHFIKPSSESSARFNLRSTCGINNPTELHDKTTLKIRKRSMDSVVTTPFKVTCDCEGTGSNFVKQTLDNISERLLTPATLLVDAADSNEVETDKNELELGTETEGILSSLSAIIIEHATTALVTTSLCLQENVTSL